MIYLRERGGKRETKIERFNRLRTMPLDQDNKPCKIHVYYKKRKIKLSFN